VTLIAIGPPPSYTYALSRGPMSPKPPRSYRSGVVEKTIHRCHFEKTTHHVPMDP